MDNNSTYSFLVGLVWGSIGDSVKDEKKISRVLTTISDNLGIRLNPVEKEIIEKECFQLMLQSIKNLMND
jgi:hypothetical protein